VLRSDGKLSAVSRASGAVLPGNTALTASYARTREMPMKFLCAIVILSIQAGPVYSEDLKTFLISPGENKTLFTNVNTSGKVYVRIVAEPGKEACLNFWWIKYPIGNVEQLGRYCNRAIFAVPSLRNGAFATKLRAGGARSDQAVGLSANEAIAHGFTYRF